jgi:hypothetical protein
MKQMMSLTALLDPDIIWVLRPELTEDLCRFSQPLENVDMVSTDLIRGSLRRLAL